MKRDFTTKIYEKLLDKLISNNYNFQTFESFLLSPKNKSRLLQEFARKLVMIFDERSMISQELMGLVDDTLHLTLHNCIKKHRLP